MEILHAVPIPPDFITFWRQSASEPASSRRWPPSPRRCCSPARPTRSGSLAGNLISPLWWTPQHARTRSSLDGTTAQRVRQPATRPSTGQQWTQPMGFNYADLRDRGRGPEGLGRPDRPGNAVASALGKLKGEAITGTYDFTNGPVPERRHQFPTARRSGGSADPGSYQLVIVDNSMNPAVARPGQPRGAVRRRFRTDQRRPAPAHRRPALDVSGVTKSFGSLTVLARGLASVAPGEAVGVVGPERRGQDHAARPAHRQPALRRRPGQRCTAGT